MPASRLSTIAASLDFVSAVAVVILSYSEHVKSVRPAPLINTYMLATLLLDGARARTAWLLRASSILPSIFMASLGLKFVLLILESLPETTFLLSPSRKYTTEETAGIFSISLFAWLHPLIKKGYRDPLSMDDLYPISYNMASELVHSRLQATWKASKRFLPLILS